MRGTLETHTDVVRLRIAGRLGTAGAAEWCSALDAATSAGGLREAGGVLEVFRASAALSMKLRLAGTLGRDTPQP